MSLIMNRSPRDPCAVLSWERTHNLAREATGEQGYPLLLILVAFLSYRGLAFEGKGKQGLERTQVLPRALGAGAFAQCHLLNVYFCLFRVLSYSPHLLALSPPPWEAQDSQMTPLKVNRTLPLCLRRSPLLHGPNRPAVSTLPPLAAPAGGDRAAGTGPLH